VFFNDDEVLAELNVRIIAADRPGCGLSDFKRNRKLLDWPDDVTELADELQIDRFAVLGVSGGGPYASACAYKIPERITTVGIVCGMGPSEAPGMKDGVSWSLPGMLSLMRRIILTLTSMGLSKDPDQFLSRTKETVSEPDRRLLDQPELAKVFIDGMQEAFRSGISGANQDLALYTKPWGFRLQDITSEVHLWHGEQDVNVPVSVGRYVAEAIPSCNARFYEQEGHFTLPYNRLREILNILA
jgi:pimeloyl-ACP methyl ester carboxylesterase